MRHVRLSLLAIIGLFFVTTTAWAATLPITNTTPTQPNPGFTGSAYTFQAKTDTVFGESICIEIQGGNGTGPFRRVEGTFGGSAGGSPQQFFFNFVVPKQPEDNNSFVRYRFFIANSGTSCNTNTNSFTLFTSFSTSPTAVTLTSFSARSGNLLVLGLGAFAAVLITGGVLAQRRKKA